MTAVKPMLATLGRVGDIDDADDDWAFEMKWDGIRAIATVNDGEVRLTTRNGNDVTGTYPELAKLARLVGDGTTLDGEIVAFGRKARPDFGRLQQRMGLTKKAEVDAARREVPVHYMVFDILRSAGKSVTSRDYSDRRALLETSVKPSGTIQVPPAFEGDLEAAMASSLKLGLEGVVAKRRDSPYSLGARNRDWIKLKHHKTQEVIVGGWRPGNGSRANRVGSLLLGIPGDEGLHYVGRVGTGFRERDLDDLTARVEKLARATSPFADVPKADASDAHWITPELVGEVEFAEWTSADRLRQPSWRGWRPDKRPDQVVRELPS